MYRAYYKCRLCGAVYPTGPATSKKLAEACMVEMNVGIQATVPMAPNMTETHNCGGQFDLGLGLADFIGWQKE